MNASDALILISSILAVLGWCGLLIDYIARRVVAYQDQKIAR